MEYKLTHPKRKSIFKAFLTADLLKFSEIERKTQIRSNELAYFLDILIKEKVVVKENSTYSLSGDARKHIPFFIEDDSKLSPLPVLLVNYQYKNKVYLCKREKQPYLGKWSMIGGRIYLNEAIEEAVFRILKQKYFIKEGKLKCINHIAHERIKEDEYVHAYILVMVTVAGKGAADKENSKWFSYKEIDKLDMIPSDRWLLQKKRSNKIKITQETVQITSENAVLSELKEI